MGVNQSIGLLGLSDIIDSILIKREVCLIELGPQPFSSGKIDRTHPLHQHRDAEEVDFLLVNKDIDCRLVAIVMRD